MASTILTTNTSALSRAADAILARKGALSKNAVLNALAAAIAGPGHDWGFLKNAPTGAFVQPGLAAPRQPAPTAWIVENDCKNDWSDRAEIFGSKGKALEFIASQQANWRHKDHPFDRVMAALDVHGEYTFEPLEEGDDDDYFDALDSAYMISLRQVEFPSADPAPTQNESLQPDQAAQPARGLVLIDPPVRYREQGTDWEYALFSDLDEVDAYGKLHDLDNKNPGWREDLHLLRDCSIEADFMPQSWFRDWAIAVDPEGDTSWEISPHEIDPRQPDLDYLKTTQHAPEWVLDWSGPFEITISVTPKN